MNKLTYQTEGMTPVWEQDFVDRAVELLNKKYRPFLENETFEVEAGYDKAQVQLKTTFAHRDGSVVYPIECVYIIDPEDKIAPQEVAELMLDYIDSYWHEYLTQGRETFVPLDWDKHSCEGVEFFLRGFVRNTALESQADELLAKHGAGQYDILPITSET